ncbi:phosphotransferase KptA/Tpt1 [Neoconidiobolus thromboides FSU 785]|nr:phosphotransferase KptA/Tpt1 [Neoconidiobolus thromboides FSU 785]
MSSLNNATSNEERKDRKNGNNKNNSNIKLSRMLSKLLRHQLPNFSRKLVIKESGYVLVESILALPLFKGHTIDEVFEVVKTDTKQRFNLKSMDDSGQNGFWIKANQGHSFEIEDQDLVQIIDHCDIPVAIHGTTLKNWELIKESSELKRMNRSHIHLAPGMIGENGVISGMRYNCEVYIYIDTEKAIKSGITFYKSLNNVILCPGPIPLNLISKVLDRNLEEIQY